jgi:hypothetical protein
MGLNLPKQLWTSLVTTVIARCTIHNTTIKVHPMVEENTVEHAFPANINIDDVLTLNLTQRMECSYPTKLVLRSNRSVI